MEQSRVELSAAFTAELDEALGRTVGVSPLQVPCNRTILGREKYMYHMHKELRV
ncbi:MAG TPA: hypothetical protein VKR54_03375 [Candidatus Babeliales bacterium]|nr:hypothetical protein [Candidatus Babeliales bacterium]